MLCGLWNRTLVIAIAAGISLSHSTQSPAQEVKSSPPQATEKTAMTTTSSTSTDNWFLKSDAQWIWIPNTEPVPNQYVQLIHEFDPSGDAQDSVLAVSVDTNYMVWLNGKMVNFGQWSDYPDDKTFDELPLKAHVKQGTNRLSILAWNQGRSTSQHRKGEPGIVFAVRSGGKIVAVSGSSTRLRLAPDYVSGNVPLVTGQLGFTFEHRGDKDDGWLAEDYKLSDHWKTPAVGMSKPIASRPVRTRPVPKLVLGERLPMRLLSQGTFSRGGKETVPGPAMQTDSLAWVAAGELIEHPHDTLPVGNDGGHKFKPRAWEGVTSGAYVILDAGKEEAGLLDLEFNAPAGTIVDIGYGEHLEDMRVRAHVGGRNFANRHVCPAGRHTLLHPFLRLAGRYIQVHIMPPAGQTTQPVTMYYAGMRTTKYPVPVAGSFKCPDTLHNKIWDVSRHTLELCMHEHYEDCPWREQSLYGMDMRNQILAGYYNFGNYDFVAASIDLLGKGMNKADGFLELCAPAEVGVNIPSFSLAWILTLDDYLMYSGDRKFVKSQLPVVQQLLERCERDSTGPLILTPRGPRMWNFYEWAPGLDGAEGGKLFGEVGTQRFDAPLNLFYVLALEATARMVRECESTSTGTSSLLKSEEYTRKAQALKAAFTSVFWNAAQQAYQTRVGDGQPPHFAELTQALALIAGVVPKEHADGLREKLAKDDNGLVKCTISHSLYKFEGLLTDRDRYATRVFDMILRDWGYMLGQGATSFWETIDGASAFGDAGSLCHGWSGIPNWFYGAWMLGVKPTQPGFKEYTMEPLKGVVDRAEGLVPTPSGVLKAEWHMDRGELIKSIQPVGK